MFDIFRQATASDFDSIWALYEQSCALQTPDNAGPGWTLGLYPTHADIQERIVAGELYVGELDGSIVAAVVILVGQDEDMQDVSWKYIVADSEVCVLHLLVVSPQHRGKHLGSALVERCLKEASRLGCRVVRLDITQENTPARHLYMRHGFEFVGTYELYYEDTGYHDFEMFECLLSENSKLLLPGKRKRKRNHKLCGVIGSEAQNSE